MVKMKQEVKNDRYINPEPYVIVTCRDEKGMDNALSIGFAANVSFKPQVIMIAVLDERYSYNILMKQNEFVVNIPTQNQKDMIEYMGSKSGKNTNKLEHIELMEADKINAPLIKECPVNFECKIIKNIKPGTHEVFFGEVLKTHCDEEYLNDNGTINWNKIKPAHSLMK